MFCYTIYNEKFIFYEDYMISVNGKITFVDRHFCMHFALSHNGKQKLAAAYALSLVEADLVLVFKDLKILNVDIQKEVSDMKF
jgi:hypothetical protein